MQKDIGNFTLNINFNSFDCWGLGFEYYSIFEYELGKISDVVPIRIIGHVLRFDFLFFFINLTKYPRTVWFDSTIE